MTQQERINILEVIISLEKAEISRTLAASDLRRILHLADAKTSPCEQAAYEAQHYAYQGLER